MTSPKSTRADDAGARRQSVTLRDKGVLTIPLGIRERLELETGDVLVLTVEGDRIVLTPAAITSREELRGMSVEQVLNLENPEDPDADKAAGCSTFYPTDEAFLASLEPDAGGPAA